MANIKVETWTIKGRKRRVYVSRNVKGGLVSWRFVAGSKINKQQATEIFKENRTFRRKVKRVNFPDSKKQIEIRTDRRDSTVPRRFQQLGLVVRWYSNNGKILGESTGYSKLLSKQSNKEAENQAFTFAKADAVGQGIIDYDNNNFEIIEKFYQSYITKFAEEKQQAIA